MNHQISHESEWLRQLRQKEEGMRREIAGAGTRSARRPTRTGSGTLAGLVHRVARICAAGPRRPAGVAPRS